MTPSPLLRVRIFVDFWNFSVSLKRVDDQFMTDWSGLGRLLAGEAANLVGGPGAFEAMHVYGSFDPAKPQDAKLRNWFTNWLDKQPGVHVALLERQKKKGYPKCPHCQSEAIKCASCEGDMRGTEEKGVDTRIVADMISLAWANAYDVAVLVSADRDFVPRRGVSSDQRHQGCPRRFSAEREFTLPEVLGKPGHREIDAALQPVVGGLRSSAARAIDSPGALPMLAGVGASSRSGRRP